MVALIVVIVATAFWPGIAEYDTVAQYQQVLGGTVDDWHPPIMVRLWQALHPLAAGMAPMFALQLALYAAGFALIVAALFRSGRWRAGLCAGLLAVSPLLLGWQMVVLKDAQMAGALVAATGIVIHYRLSGRRVPAVATAFILVLLAYGTFVRGNAAFATAPLAVLLLQRPAPIIRRAALAVGVLILVLPVSPLINQRLLGAAPSGIAKSQPVFDLAAIAEASHDPRPFTEAERGAIRARHCVKAFFWDPLGDPTACGPATERLKQQSETKLYLELARAAVKHPFVYAGHRLLHWNSTERWLVAPGLIGAGPPDEAEPNDVGLETPRSPIVGAWQSAAAFEAGTPLGWPIAWTLIGLLLAPLTWRRRFDPAGSVALALIASALTLEASFLAISIASDLRYHLWPMTASALALVLLSDDIRLRSRSTVAAGGLLALAIAAGLWTRATLPRAPDTYQAAIHAPTG